MKTPLDKNDKIWEVLSMTLLLAMALLIIFSLPSLPDTIPIHFTMEGKTDGYGSKYMLWMVFGIAALFNALMTFVSLKPELYNNRMTENNIEEQHRLTSKMIRTLKTCILVFFLLLTYFMLQTAQGKWTDNIVYLLFALFVLVFVPIIYYLIKLGKVR